MNATTARPKLQGILAATLPPLALTGFLWLTSENDVSSLQVTIGLALLYIPWISYLRWKKRGQEVFPLFAMIAFMYWVYYGVPLFWTDRLASDPGLPLGREVPDRAITSALVMALLGVCALWTGMKTGAGRIVRIRVLQSVAIKPSQMNYLRLLLVVCSVLSFSEGLTLALGAGGRQAITTLITMVPTLAFVVLLRNYLHRKAETIDKLLILFFLGVRLLTGLSSGWLGSFASIILICAAVYLAEFKKLPRLVSLTAVVFILFFQVGKQDFRKVYWQKEAEPTGRIERVTFWTETSLAKWGEVVSNPNGKTIREALNPSFSRVSLLTQAANVIDQTPSVVPYQYGQLYSYMLITLIPRAIWPDKPSMNEANQFYQVAYGLSTEDELSSVSIGVGVLAEGYISFGWAGAIIVMFLLGMFFDLYQRLLLSKGSGGFMIAMGIVLLPLMLSLESQMAAYLGGIVQQVLFTILVFLPVIRLGQKARPLALTRFNDGVSREALIAEQK